MTGDIRQLESDRRWVRRWVKTDSIAYGNQILGQGVKLIAIDSDTGETRSPGGYEVGQEKWNAAPTKEQAVEETLADAIAEADEDLARRMRDAPLPKPRRAPLDPATRRFLGAD
jgi:hypothetical protein